MKIEEKEENNEKREGKKERGKERVGRNSLFKVKRRCSLRLVFFVRTSIICFSFLLNSLKKVTGNFSEIKAMVV